MRLTLNETYKTHAKHFSLLLSLVVAFSTARWLGRLLWHGTRKHLTVAHIEKLFNSFLPLSVSCCCLFEFSTLWLSRLSSGDWSVGSVWKRGCPLPPLKGTTLKTDTLRANMVWLRKILTVHLLSSYLVLVELPCPPPFPWWWQCKRVSRASTNDEINGSGACCPLLGFKFKERDQRVKDNFNWNKVFTWMWHIEERMIPGGKIVVGYTGKRKSSKRGYSDNCEEWMYLHRISLLRKTKMVQKWDQFYLIANKKVCKLLPGCVYAVSIK